MAGFYSPIARIWEILLGALLASLVRQGSALPGRGRDAAAAVGLVFMGGTFLLLHDTMAYPGAFALFPVVGTACVIMGRPDSGLNRVLLSARPPVYTGRISYPLYLWHWPLLAILRTGWGEVPPREWRLALLAVASILAVVTYEVLERPIRSRTASWRVTAALLGIVFLGGVAGLAAQPLRAALFPAHLAENPLGWPPLQDHNCGSRYRANETGWIYCRTNSDAPAILLLGNSHANHLYPGFASQPALAGRGIVNLGACWPIDSFVREGEHVGDDPCAVRYAKAQTDFIARLSQHIPSVRYAIIAAAWPYFLPNGSEVSRADGKPVAYRIHSTMIDGRRATERDQYVGSLERSISQLEAQHIQVILVLDTPWLPYDPRQCLNRPLLGRKQDCIVFAESQKAARAGFVAGLAGIQARHSFLIYDPLSAFCDRKFCRLASGEAVFLRDSNHLSLAGSQTLAKDFQDWAKDHTPQLLAHQG